MKRVGKRMNRRQLQWGPVPEDQERYEAAYTLGVDDGLQWGPVPEDQERPKTTGSGSPNRQCSFNGARSRRTRRGRR